MAQSTTPAQDPNRFFNNDENMPVGAYYYPEAWPASRWERDISNMAKLGFKFTHIGEFAWAALEPEEGKYDWSWMDKTLELCQKYNLKVIMCTPSPTPPAWLTSKYPDALLYNAEGRMMQHGGRQHASWSSPNYQLKVTAITEALAKRYGNHPAVMGWQLDNEPSHYDAHYDFSPVAQAEFRKWLKVKYKNVDELNKEWGGAFWSFQYNSIDEVLLPNAKAQVQSINPHAWADFVRFNSQELAKFLRMQTNVLRKHIPATQFVTTNYAYFKFLPEINPWDSKDHLDFSSYTMYLLSTYLDKPTGSLAHRLGSGLGMSYAAEFAKSTHGVTGIMELQPGIINWGEWNSQPLPGAVRMWLWHNYLLGSKFACTYRFDRPIYGGELYHSGIMAPDGVTVDRGGQEFADFIKEINTLKPQLSATAKEPEVITKRRMAICWNQDNLNVINNHKQSKFWDNHAHLFKYFGSAKRFGAPVTFIDEATPFKPEEYAVAVAPAYQLLDPALVAKWEKYVEAGGHLVLTTRTGQMDRNGHLWEGPWAAPIVNLIGANIDSYDNLPTEMEGHVKLGDQSFAWHVWAENLVPMTKPNKGQPAEVWASYADDLYANKPAVIHRKLGKGSVTYVGVDSKDGALEFEVMKKVYALAGIGVENYPPYFFTGWRNGAYVAVNYTSETVKANIPAGAKILLGSQEVKPGGVVIWK